MSLTRIMFAAILVDGLIFLGKRHHNIIQTLAECGYSSKTIQQSPQGFVTSIGGFVGREEAAQIALDCGQIDKLKFSSRELFSEDLY